MGAVLSSLVAHEAVWHKAFALGPRMPDDPLSQVVQRHVSSFSNSLCLNVLPWEGQTLLGQFDGFAELPWLRVCVASQLPPVAHLQLQAKTGLMVVAGWVPLSDDVSNTVRDFGVVSPLPQWCVSCRRRAWCAAFLNLRSGQART